MNPRLLRSLIVSLAILLLSGRAQAQSCGPGWLIDTNPPSAMYPVYALTVWDPDGAGPLPPVLVAGGYFTSSGNVNYIGLWDGWNWKAVDTGMDGPVMALSVDANGDLIAGGNFSMAGSTTANNIARWDGSAWHAIGTNVSGGGVAGGTGNLECTASLPPGIRALTVLGNGDLVAGGLFTYADGTSANNIAKWNGSAWQPLSSGTNGEVDALTVMPNGNLIAGGLFTLAGGASVNNLARWTSVTGSPPAWQDVGGGADKCVLALAVIPSGDLIVGGDFGTVGVGTTPVSIANLARWDGSSWHQIGSSDPDNAVAALVVLANGDLVAAGQFSSVGGVSAAAIALWDGFEPSPPGSPAWYALDAGLTGAPYAYTVFALAAMPAGDVVAGGYFTYAGAHAVNGVASWDGTRASPPGSPDWHPLVRESSIDAINGTVRAFVIMDDGSLVAGGDFTTAGGVSANRIARWDGVAWSTLGSGMDNSVYALTLIPDGSMLGTHFLVAGGEFDTADGVTVHRIARWDGSAWNPMNVNMDPTKVGMNGTVNALAYSPYDGLVAGGAFTTAGTHNVGYIAYWTGTPGSALGTNWSTPAGLGGMDNIVNTLAYNSHDTTLVAGGDFTTADGGSIGHGIAVLDSQGCGCWVALDTGTSGRVDALAVRASDGHVFAGGLFSNASSSTGTAYVAEWDGASWNSLDGGMDSYVHALGFMANGNLVAGGDFTIAGVTHSTSANRVATWNGTIWSPLTTGIDNTVHALAKMPSGELEVGGGFTTAGDKTVQNFARWSPDGVPWIAVQPMQGEVVPLYGTLNLVVTPASGYDFDGPLSFQWKYCSTAPCTGSAISDGAHGVCSTGGTVSGAQTDSLEDAVVGACDMGVYSVSVTNTCGTGTSNVSIVAIACPADFDHNGHVQVADIFAYLSAWFAAGGTCPTPPAPCPADFNHSGTVTVSDIFAFLSEWFSGC